MDLSTDSDPILALDIGGTFTRAFLFDKIRNKYHLLGGGKTNTTFGIFGQNVRHGVRLALEELQANTGRILMGTQKDLIQPVTSAGNGVNQCFLTISAGPPVKIFLIGATKDISDLDLLQFVRSACSSQLSVYAIDDDNQPPESILDEILLHRPDLIIISAGSAGSATDVLKLLIEPVRFTFMELPAAYRPEVLFIGNQTSQSLVKSYFSHSQHFHFVPSLRPGLDPGSLEFARLTFAALIVKIRGHQLPGLLDLIRWSQGNVLTSPVAFGRMIQFISEAHITKKRVLGIDIGVSGVSVSTAVSGRLTMGLYDLYRFPGNDFDALTADLVKPVLSWLVDPEISTGHVIEYIYNRSIYPSSLSWSTRDVHIQEALLRHEIGLAVNEVIKDSSLGGSTPKGTPLVSAEPILASGGVFATGAHPGRVCLSLLDSLQPKGITTLISDPLQVAASIGAIAALNQEAALQVTETDIFSHLATVISPVGSAPPGTPILRVSMLLEDGSEKTVDIKQGEIDVLSLPLGKAAQLQLQPFQRFDIGMGGPGRGGTLKVVGSTLGIVIDGRGRPLKLPEDFSRRKEAYRKWQWMLGC